MEQVWFAIGCTSPRHELKVRDDARRYGLSSFVPLKYEVKKVKGREQRMLVPAITKLIFVKGTLEEVQDYLAHAHFVVYIQRSTFSNHKEFLTVPTQAMEDFIAVTEHHEEHVTYFNPQEIRLNVGDQIRVKGGLYDGREGIIMRIKGKRNRHLVVQIPGILIAAIEMTPDMIEIPDADEPQKPSKNVDKDKRVLFDLAHRLLFEIPDKYQNENEYYLLLSELKRTQARLTTFKGYTPATEAELALPLYMTSVKLDVGVETAESRIRKAISALKDSSLLKVRCQLYLAILSHDEALLQQLQTLFDTWRKTSLSPNQRSLIEEFSLLK
ncbi:MAG: UpxY family transcription antiterminator [Prevotella sp.]|nr:UpxY family transcription antiterminator [Prevotella sp.]